jgi:NAD(P)-dependent dehydrogenase (short-subunit alcohol dehydrogenase family)
MHDLLNLNKYRAKDNLLAGKNILVTGAGDGIGSVMAQCYAQYGATVILLGRSEKKLEAVYDSIEAAGGAQPAIVPFDLSTTDEARYTELAQQIDDNIGSMHGLLHNAGQLGELKPLAQFNAEKFRHLLDVNFLSNFLLTKALLPALNAADNASIIFTASGVGRRPRAYWGAYSIAKAATEALMQVWADELESTSHIRVNSLNPGATRTAMRAQAYPAEAPTSNPAAEDITGAYLFLMADDSIGVNAQQLNARPM